MNLRGRPIPAPNSLYIHKKKIPNSLGEIVQEDGMEEPCRSSRHIIMRTAVLLWRLLGTKAASVTRQLNGVLLGSVL